MLNKVSIMGRLVRDPELRRTQSGIAVTTMRIAVDRDYKGPDGTKQADFFDVVAWRNTAEFVSRYFAKGRMMIVDGRLQTREWNDREGNRRTSVEIVADNIYFGDSRRDGPNGESGGYGGGYGSAPGYGSGASGGYSGGYGNSGGYGSSNGYGSGASGGYGGYGSSNGYGSGSSGGYG
ncbi:MAG: single-stranded DNA-binding protein, partial [Oscillospiraceae bacterium]|nr:single-stranded DNA-binding protein [Oscillospiraceae bacterium]